MKNWCESPIPRVKRRGFPLLISLFLSPGIKTPAEGILFDKKLRFLPIQHQQKNQHQQNNQH